MSEIKGPLWKTRPVLLDGPWTGWRPVIGADPFEDHAGPFYTQRALDGGVVCAFDVGAQHLNGAGAVHGGCLLTLADLASFVIAQDNNQMNAGVTVSLNAEFISAAVSDERVEARGDLVRAGRSLCFVRGLISVQDRAVLSFSSVLKRVDR